MTTFNNNNELHHYGFHVFGSSWQVKFENRPYPRSAILFNNATVVGTHVNTSRSKSMTSIALIGGSLERGTAMSSVMILQDIFNVRSNKKWHNGPNMNECREYMAASVCHGYAYVIGGADDNDIAGGGFLSDTIETIPVSELFNEHKNPNAIAWTTLSARLSGPRQGCTAVTVHDRFIVVIGGENCHGIVLTAVDIIDTMTQAGAPNMNNHYNNEGHHSVVTVSTGPSLQTPRSFLGATVLDDQIWVVGGSDEMDANVVECLRYGSQSTSDDNSQTIFSSHWNVRPELTLHHGRSWHRIVPIGQCLVVVAAAGGRYYRDKAVELLDLQRGVVLELPDMVDPRDFFKMMQMINNGLLVLCTDTHYGGLTMELIPWINLSLSQLKKYSEELELRQPRNISGLVIPFSESQQEEATSQVLLGRAKVESFCDSLVYFYLFHKGGHVSYLQQQNKQSLPESNNANKRYFEEMNMASW